MSTSAERTVRVPQENRIVFVEGLQGSRTVRIPQENRTVTIVRPFPNNRTVYVTED